MHCYYKGLVFSVWGQGGFKAASPMGQRSTVVSIEYSRMRSIDMRMHDYIIHMVTSYIFYSLSVSSNLYHLSVAKRPRNAQTLPSSKQSPSR